METLTIGFSSWHQFRNNFSTKSWNLKILFLQIEEQVRNLKSSHFQIDSLTRAWAVKSLIFSGRNFFCNMAQFPLQSWNQASYGKICIKVTFIHFFEKKNWKLKPKKKLPKFATFFLPYIALAFFSFLLSLPDFLQLSTSLSLYT